MVKDPLFINGSFIPLYRQFTDDVKARIRSGEFSPSEALPSINAMVIRTGLSRETVIKGYGYLCREGVLVSRKGKGYFVKESYLSGVQSIMVFMDKMSQHQQDIMDGFMAAVGSGAEMTIRMHYQSPQYFAQALEASLDRYDWYILFPHFSQDESTMQKIRELIERIPPQKLIIMDRLPSPVPPGCGACFQSIEKDVPRALDSAIDDIRKYNRIRYISLSVSLYGNLVADTLRSYGRQHGIQIDILEELPEVVEKGEIYFVSGSRLDRKLSMLLRAIRESGLTPGKEVGLICYNDFPLNEFIFGGLTTLSVDFIEMGRAAGEMVLSGVLSQVQCQASLIRRNTF